MGGVSATTRVEDKPKIEPPKIEEAKAPEKNPAEVVAPDTTAAPRSDSFQRTDEAKEANALTTDGVKQGDVDPALQKELQARLRGETPTPVAAATAVDGAEKPTPKELIEGSKLTFDLAASRLDAGDGEGAAKVLSGAATELRAGIEGADAPEKYVLETLANNMDKRALAYRADHPNDVLGAAGSLNMYGRNAMMIGEGIEEKHPEYGQYLQQVGKDSRIQAEVLAQTAANTKSMIGRGVGNTYRDIVNASLDRDIAGSGSINNFFTGNRDELEADKKKMNTVFDHMDKKMEAEGLTFHEAWHDMFRDNHINKQGELPGFATPHDAAAFIRDHDSTKGLLAPMAELSEGIINGDQRVVDKARGDVVKSLRENDQWDIAKQVLSDYKANAATPEGQKEAAELTDNERGEWWKAKAGQFVSEDLPVLLLTGVVTGGAGLGVRALGAAAGWGARAQRIAGVATELGAFVPTERVLNDAINNRKADWSPGAMARDLAFTVGGYGVFKALGAGWRAVRKPALTKPTLTPNANNVPDGRVTKIPKKEAPENIRALTRENETAKLLAEQGYKIKQNPTAPGSANPDYLINGRLFDNFAPNGSSPRSIATTIANKVKHQAPRIVLTLDDSAVSMAALRKQLADWPIEGLEQLIVVKGGKVIPFKVPPPSNPAGFTPGAYPYQEGDR